MDVVNTLKKFKDFPKKRIFVTKFKKSDNLIKTNRHI